VRIAGAGPAGLCAALALARADVPVEVYEKHDAPNPHLDGAIHGIENWTSARDVLAELREHGVPTDAFEHTAAHSLLFSDGRAVRKVESQEPLFYMVSRGLGPGALERGLLDAALALGVRVRWKHALAPDQADIVATGGAPARRFCVEAGFQFETPQPDMAFCLLHGPDWPSGYSYMLVRNGRGCLCTVVFNRFREARAFLDRAEATMQAKLPVTKRARRYRGGCGSLAVEGAYRSGDGVPRIGEAAGLQDVLWGFGIRTALLSGALLARCIVEGADWQSAARALFGGRYRTGVVNRWMWERAGHRLFPLYGHALGGRHAALAMLRRVHARSWVHGAAFPIARMLMERDYPGLFR
jgi:flavin-dependent dehydrogenase